MSHFITYFMVSESQLQKFWLKVFHGIAGKALTGAGVLTEGSAEEGSLTRLTCAVACFLELLLQCHMTSCVLSLVQMWWERWRCRGMRDGEGGMTERARGKSKMGDIFQLTCGGGIPLFLLLLLTTIADLCSVGGELPRSHYCHLGSCLEYAF